MWYVTLVSVLFTLVEMNTHSYMPFLFSTLVCFNFEWQQLVFWGFAEQLTIYHSHLVDKKAKATFPIRLGHGLNRLPRQRQEINIAYPYRNFKALS